MTDDTKITKNQTDDHSANAKPADKTNPENRQDKLNERLDEGLEETFPSSDPVSVKITK